MLLAAAPRSNRIARRSAFTLLEVLVVVAILVILATIASVAVTRNLDDARKSQAHLKAAAIAKAMESYYINPGSNNTYPTSMQELRQPPWGGTSFLTDPQNDPLTPWNNQEFAIEMTVASDGSAQGKPYVHTQAPDGTPVSNFGIGDKAMPR